MNSAKSDSQFAEFVKLVFGLASVGDLAINSLTRRR